MSVNENGKRRRPDHIKRSDPVQFRIVGAYDIDPDFVPTFPEVDATELNQEQYRNLFGKEFQWGQGTQKPPQTAPIQDVPGEIIVNVYTDSENNEIFRSAWVTKRFNGFFEIFPGAVYDVGLITDYETGRRYTEWNGVVARWRIAQEKVLSRGQVELGLWDHEPIRTLRRFPLANDA